MSSLNSFYPLEIWQKMLKMPRFRWVACQIDALKNCYDYPRLQRALRCLPKTLDDTYTRILENIPKDHIRQTMTILNLLAWSDRNFKINELVDAIAVNLDEDPGFDPRNRMPVPREVLKLCSSLVVVSRERHRVLSSDEDKLVYVVRLAHFSVKEYLISDHVSKAYELLLSESVARAYLARLCLTYLIGVSRLAPLGAVEYSSRHPRTFHSSFPFVDYSSQHWMDHARGIENRDESLWKLIMSFFLAEPEALGLATSCAPYSWEIDEQRTASPIPYASAAGLTQVVGHLIDTGAGFADADATATHNCLGEALQLASRVAHDTTVQLLLDRGADASVGDGIMLSRASMGGHDTIVKLLLDSGADANGRDGFALWQASAQGYDTIVQLLLDSGADATAGDCFALRMAARDGHETIVQLLLDSGADVNAASGAALREASGLGHDRTVRLLLDRGANIHAGDDAALCLASENRHGTVVQHLICRGADINTHDGLALRLASEFGQHTIVQLLLDRSAEINIRGEDRETALTKASKNHHYTVMQLLLGKGASIHPEDLIDALARNDHRAERVVSIMLPYVTQGLAAQKDQHKMNILHHASIHGSEAVVQKCLDLDIDVHARDSDAITALGWAAYKGHFTIVKMLVRAGSDLEEVSGDGYTPLRGLANLSPGQTRARSWERDPKSRGQSSHGSSRESSRERSRESSEERRPRERRARSWDRSRKPTWSSSPESVYDNIWGNGPRSWRPNQAIEWEAKHREIWGVEEPPFRRKEFARLIEEFFGRRF